MFRTSTTTPSVTSTPTSLPENPESNPCTSAALSVLVLLVLFICCVLLAGLYNSCASLHRICRSTYRLLKHTFSSGPPPGPLPNNMGRYPGQPYRCNEYDPRCPCEPPYSRPSTTHNEKDPSDNAGPAYGPAPFHTSLAATERQNVQQRLVLHEQKIEALGLETSKLRQDLDQLVRASIAGPIDEARAKQERSPPSPPLPPNPLPTHPGRAMVGAHFAEPGHPAVCGPCCRPVEDDGGRQGAVRARFGGGCGISADVERVARVQVPWNPGQGVGLRPLGLPGWEWWGERGWLAAQAFERPAWMPRQGRVLWGRWRPEVGGEHGGGVERVEGECACESETDEEMETESETETGSESDGGVTPRARPAELAAGSAGSGEDAGRHSWEEARDAAPRQGGMFEQVGRRLRTGHASGACGPRMEQSDSQAARPSEHSPRGTHQGVPDIYYPQGPMPEQPAGAPNDGLRSWLSKHDIEGFAVAILLSLRNEDYPAAIHRDRRTRQGIMLWDRFIRQLADPHERQWLNRCQVHATIYQLLMECDRADANLSSEVVAKDAPVRAEQAHRITAALYNKAARDRRGMCTLLEEIVSHDAQQLWRGDGKMASHVRDELDRARIVTYPLGHGVRGREGNRFVDHDVVRCNSGLDLNASTRDERPAVPQNLFDFASMVLRRAREREERGHGRRSSVRRTCGREDPSAGSAASEGEDDESIF